jgi:hypothetical protein
LIVRIELDEVLIQKRTSLRTMAQSQRMRANFEAHEALSLLGLLGIEASQVEG